jgi:hypothetical protein
VPQRPGLYPNGNPQPDYLEPAIVEQLPALIGKDPRQLTLAELQGLGHEKQPLLKVIRTNCVECAGGSEAEVRRCRMHHCPFWPYRMGTNPFHKQALTEEQRAARRGAFNRHVAVGSPGNFPSKNPIKACPGIDDRADPDPDESPTA